MSSRTLPADRRTVAIRPAKRIRRERLLRWIVVHFAPLRARHELLDAPAQPRLRRAHREQPLRPMAPR